MSSRDAELLEQWRPVLEARRKLEQLRERKQKQSDKRRSPRRRARAAELTRGRANRRLELAALELRPRGPGLEPWQQHRPRSYVIEQDLEQLPRDGSLYREHVLELRRRGGPAGMLPREVLLLQVLAWCHQRRPGGNGAGFQGRKEVLARILGCSRSWVYELLGRLERRGQVLAFDRKRKFAPLAAELPGRWTDVDGQPRSFTRWKDSDGKVRAWVDVHGVVYATPRGVTDALGRERDPRGAELAHGLWTRLWKTLRRAARRITARLSVAPATEEEWTPYRGDAVQISTLRGASSSFSPARSRARWVERPSGAL